MRILFTSDWHLDKSTGGVSRLADFQPYLDRLIKVAETVDLVAHAGDFFDPGTLDGPMLTVNVMAAIDQITNAAPFVGIAGNHDVVETSSGWTVLSPIATAIRHGAYGGHADIVERPVTLHFNDKRGDVGLLCLPYQARAAFNPDTVQAAFQRAIDEYDRVVVLSHYTVPGAVQGSESKEMSRGRDVDLPSLDALNPVLVVNGHYHRAQVVRYGEIDVHIPGSPHRFTFGEAGDVNKGFMVAEV